MKIARKNKKKRFLILAAAIVLIVGACYAWYYFFIRSSNHPHTTTTHSGQKIVSDPNVPGGTKKPDASEDMSGIGISKEPSTPAKLEQNVTPKTPVGVFVSNHHPNLSGTPAPNTINSTCSTTPGAFCTITFTQGNLVKSLPQQQTDSSGNTEWNWSLQQIGLTSGSWNISATASNGNLTSSTSDATHLEVQQ